MALTCKRDGFCSAFLLVALFLAIACTAAVQAAELKFQHVGLEEGLPNAWVFAFAEDTEGFIWIGTDAGLVRYDGYDTVVYERDPEGGSATLSSNQVRAIYVQRRNRIWVGSRNGGLDRFNPQNGTFSNISFGTHPVSNIRSIVEYQGALYIGTRRGLFTLAEGAEVAEPVALGQDLSISSLAIDRSRRLWIGARTGLFTFDISKADSLVEVPLQAQDDGRVLSISIDQNDTVWIAAGKHVYSKSSGALEPQRHLAGLIPEAFVTSIKALRSGQIAIGTLKGLHLFDPFSEQLSTLVDDPGYTSSLRDPQVYSLFEDGGGTMWVGTYRGGVSYANPEMQRFGLYRAFGECSVAAATAAVNDSSGNTWVTRVQGVARFDSSGHCQEFSLSDAQSYGAPAFGANGAVFVPIEPLGLAVIEPGAAIMRYLEHPRLRKLLISSTLVDDVGGLWIASEKDGLFRLTPDRHQLETFGDVGGGDLYHIEPWGERLLLGTSSGVVSYNPSTRARSRPFSIPEGISIGPIVLDFMRQKAWLGSRSNGLWMADLNTGETKPVEPRYGFLGNTVRAIVMDRRGTIWASSTQGLFSLVQDADRFQRYVPEDGLQGNEFFYAAYDQSTDTVLLAGVNGINLFKSDAIHANSTPPQVRVTRFGSPSQRGQLPLIALDGQIELAHDSKDFSFELVALQFDDPRRNQYAYRLQAYDSEWIHTSADQRQGTYTNLSPGDYQLMVKAANKDGVWSEPEGALSITVLPAPWATWWAQAGYALLAISLIYGYQHWRVRAANRRAFDLQLEVDQRTLEIAEQKDTIERLLERKDDLLAAVSHELRTPLTLMVGPLQSLSSKLGGDGTHNELGLIRRSSQRLAGLVDQLIQLAELDRNQVDATEIVQLERVVPGIAESYRSAARQLQMDIVVRNNTQQSVVAHPNTVETVLSNLISNALKYASRPSDIVIDFESRGETVAISVENVGPGVSPEQSEMIFQRFYRVPVHARMPGAGLGLAISRALARASSGELTVASVPNRQTIFTLTLPASEEQMNQSNHSSAALEPLIQLESLTSPTISLTIEEPISPEPDTRPVVLVIEDDNDMRQFVVQCLSGHFECLSAPSGEKGIALAREHVPDLIVCDVLMPGLDGYCVARAIRQDERTSHVPIVMLTAKIDRGSRMQGWEENIDEYLSKPFDPIELVARIENLLAVRRILRRQFVKEQDSIGGEPVGFDLPECELKFIKRVDDALDKSFRDPEFGPDQVAEACAMSLRQLQRKLKALTSFSPSDYLREHRLRQASAMLKEGYRVGLIADECGFSSAVVLSRQFKARYGLSPKQYQQRFLQSNDSD